jgi:hypothetical protein
MSGPTASNLTVVCGVGAVTCTRNAQKRAIRHRYRHAATASWWTERKLIPPTIEATGTPRKRCERKSRRERPRLQREGCSLPATPSQGCPSRRCYAATHDKNSCLSSLSCTDLLHSLERQPTTSAKSVS